MPRANGYDVEIPEVEDFLTGIDKSSTIPDPNGKYCLFPSSEFVRSRTAETIENSASRVIATSDRNTIITATTACTFFLPTNSSDPIPVGSVFMIGIDTAGVVKVKAQAGVTLWGIDGGEMTFKSRYGSAYVRKRSATAWQAFGDLEDPV